MDQKTLLEIKKFKGFAVLFTDRKKIVNFVATIKNLPEKSAIIIREYDLDKKSREVFAREISELARPRGIKILVGKDLVLAKKIKADGIHFSDLDKIPLSFFKKKSFPKNFLLSVAVHDPKLIDDIAKAKPDMLFITPIFKSTSHLGAKTLGIKNLAKITSKYKNLDYLYALGGVNATNLKAISKLNLAGFGAIDLFATL